MNESAIPPGTPEAPLWSALAGVVGRYSVFAAIALFFLSFTLAFLPRGGRLTKTAFTLGALSLLTTFVTLAALFLGDRFEYRYVFSHSDRFNPLQYKLSAIWTDQTGSFLLWGVTSSLFGAWAVLRAKEFARAAAGVMALPLAGIAAILALDSPFHLLADVVRNGRTYVPANGTGMPPLLQNYWNAIHPPIVFSGFGLLIVPFALGLAGLLRRDLTGWIAPARPFVLWGVSILGLGISLGGLWAYESQGWGGFWAWDPVENVSLVPWLFMVALAHGMIAQARSRRGSIATLVLAGLPFLAFVYGTFLTRSGLLEGVSNHSFARMDKATLQVLRGVLVGVLIAYVGSVAAAFRMAKTPEPVATATAEKGYERGQAYSAGIVLISLISLVIAVGMSWPVIVALRGGRTERVEETLYQQALIPFFIPLLLLMAVAPFMKWRGETPTAIGRRVMNAFSISLGLFGLLLLSTRFPGSPIVLDPNRRVSAPFGLQMSSTFVIGGLLWLLLFVAVANLQRLAGSLKKNPMTLGGLVSHIGIAVLLGGLLLSHGLERKERLFLRPGAPAEALGYRIAYEDFQGKDIYDRDGKVLLTVTRPDGHRFEARPGLYYYDQNEGAHAEEPQGPPKANVLPHIERSFTHDVYVAMSAPITDAFETPVSLKPGETKTQGGITLQYIEPTMSGQPGQPGARFGALVRITYKGKSALSKPEIELTGGGIRPTLSPAGEGFKLAMVAMNAADRSAQLQVLLSPPVYPIELYEKPLTSLVWLGTGIFTLGGAMSAFARRLRRPSPAPRAVPATDPPTDFPPTNRAPLPTP